MRDRIENRQFDEERALYHLMNTDVVHCTFAGPADGESAMKESRDIQVDSCSFSLRYPLWHARRFALRDSTLDDMTRAAIWYSEDGEIERCSLGGIKAVRECSRIRIDSCKVNSAEFGWKSRDITMKDTDITAEYLFLDSSRITLDHVSMKGKYSFQYIDGLTITDSVLDTKDAFWHTKNAVVKNSTLKGEYLAWFSENLTLVDCRIIGTQPLCYCRGLKLINCTMEETDLAFEYSEVEADVRSHVESIKNPRSGRITVDSVGEIIRDDPVMPCTGEVIIRG